MLPSVPDRLRDCEIAVGDLGKYSFEGTRGRGLHHLGIAWEVTFLLAMLVLLTMLARHGKEKNSGILTSEV